MTDLELEEKKRKAGEVFFLAYMDAMRKQEQAQVMQIIDDAFKGEEADPDKLREKVIKDIESSYELYAKYVKATEKMHDFFALDESDLETANVRASLASVDLTEEDFHIVSLASAGDDMDSLCDFFNSDEEPEPEEIRRLDKIRNKAVLEARESLYKYANNDPAIFAKKLANGLRVSCEAFRTEKRSEVAMQWSMVTDEILRIMKKDPRLVKTSGLTKNQTEIAEKVSELGRIIKEGLKSVERIAQKVMKADDRLKEESVSEDMGKVISMQIAVTYREGISKTWDAPDDPTIKAPVL